MIWSRVISRCSWMLPLWSGKMTWDWRRRLLCGRLAGKRIRRQRAPLGWRGPERSSRRIRLRGHLLGLGGWLLWLWTGVVVGELDADLTSILALAGQVMP